MSQYSHRKMRDKTMNTRQKKKRMNMFLKRRGIPHAMRIQDVSLFIPVPINDLYQKYIEDRTRENRNKRLAIVERRVAEEYIKGGQAIEYASSTIIHFREENKND